MPAMDKIIAGNIFLVGLMGAGKTTLGKQLAEHLHCQFYDSDQYICDKTGVSIPTIFELEGEESFRNRESQAINELTQLQPIVLATGGGSVLRQDNRYFLLQRGVVVYVHVLPEILVERTRNDRNRPLLQVVSPLDKFRELYTLRDPIYRQIAHIILEVGTAPLSVTFQQLIAELAKIK